MEQISLLFTGDVMAHDNQLQAAWNDAEAKYDFSRNFKNIIPHIRSADLAVCNLETTIAGGKPTGFPKFNTPDALVDAIAEAGFSCVSAANNHSYDSGESGIIKTRKALERRKLPVIGIRKNPREKAYAVFDIRGIRVALLNFTMETAGCGGKRTLNNHVLRGRAKKLLNSFCFESIEADLQQVQQEISQVRKNGAQIVIIYYHWGNEYERYANVMQKYIAWQTARMGVDAIIGSHAHVLQEQDVIPVCIDGREKTVPVFYGLGNYVWGAPPIRERETVLNNILARLDIHYDHQSGQTRVEPSYVPMFIGQKGGYEPIDMGSLPEQEYGIFQEKYGIHPDTVLEQIRTTVENQVNPVPSRLYFDRVFRLQVGQRASLLEGFLPENTYVKFSSEDAIVASAMQNGVVVGNSAGYVGMTAVDRDGIQTQFLVQVLPGKRSRFPIIVNEHNRIRDIYRPAPRVKGMLYELPEGVSLCRPAAEAWKKMLAEARRDNVQLKLMSGHRTRRDQILRRKEYAAYYSEAAALRRYQRPGCSEHHLGTALDIKNGQETTKAEAFGWLQRNASRFGFVVRPMKCRIEQMVYLHLRYLGDIRLAGFLHEKGLTPEQFLTDYEAYTCGGDRPDSQDR